MNFKGKIVKFGETATGAGQNGEWSRTPIWCEEIDKQYPNSFVFDAFNKPLEGLAPGMIVNIEFNGKASEYNGRLYNSLSIYKIEKVYSEMKKPDSALSTPNPPNPIDNPETYNDLPF